MVVGPARVQGLVDYYPTITSNPDTPILSQDHGAGAVFWGAVVQL